MTPGESIDFKVEPDLDGREKLAVSAQQHYEAIPDYRPPGLVTYLSDPASVHLEPVPEKAWY